MDARVDGPAASRAPGPVGTTSWSGRPGPVGTTSRSGRPGPVGTTSWSGRPGPVGTTARSGRPGPRIGHAALARFAAIAALAAGCLGAPKLARQREWVELHPEAPEQIKRAVLGKKLVEGMTVDAVRASWGEPGETAELGGGVARLTYVRKQELTGVRVSVEYMLVFDHGVLIRIHRQKYR